MWKDPALRFPGNEGGDGAGLACWLVWCQAGNRGGPVSSVEGFLWNVPAHQVTTGLAELFVRGFDPGSM